MLQRARRARGRMHLRMARERQLDRSTRLLEVAHLGLGQLTIIMGRLTSQQNCQPIADATLASLSAWVTHLSERAKASSTCATSSSCRDRVAEH